jgi:hypothetical protein
MSGELQGTQALCDGLKRHVHAVVVVPDHRIRRAHAIERCTIAVLDCIEEFVRPFRAIHVSMLPDVSAAA